MRSTFITVTALALLCSSCTSEKLVVPEGMVELYLLNQSSQKISLVVEIADTPETRAQGFMFREYIPENHGMLFVFEEETPRTFWMKNTLVPLDILYFSADHQLVDWVTMEPCQSDPCPRYPSSEPSQYALELPAGFIESHNLNQDWSFIVQSSL